MPANLGGETLNHFLGGQEMQGHIGGQRVFPEAVVPARDFGASDWTGTVTIDQAGNITFTQGNSQIAPTNVPAQNFGRVPMQVTRSVNVRIQVPDEARWTNRDQIITIQVNAVQPQGIFAPTVRTVDAFSVAATSVSLRGQVTDFGNGNLSNYGITYSRNSNLNAPIQVNSNNIAGNGTFSVDVTGLSPETVYYFRAFATNEAGTGTGNILMTETGVAPLQPADILGQISVDALGNVTVTSNDRGFVYYIGAQASGGTTFTGPSNSVTANSVYPLSNTTVGRTPFIGVEVDDPEVPNDGVQLSIRTIATVNQPPALPNVTTADINPVRQTNATLNGGINSAGAAATSASFYWIIDETARDANYLIANGTEVTVDPSFGSKTAEVVFASSLMERNIQAVLIASNANGTTQGAVVSETIPGVTVMANSVETRAAQNVMATSFDAHGFITQGMNNSVLSAGFIFGLNEGEVNRGINSRTGDPLGTGVGTITIAKTDDGAYLATITSLTPNTEYFFQAWVRGAVGFQSGGTLSVTTEVQNTITASGTINFSGDGFEESNNVSVVTVPPNRWEIVTQPDFVQLMPDFANNSVTGQAEQYTGFGPRTGEVTVRHLDDPTLTATFRVRQFAGI